MLGSGETAFLTQISPETMLNDAEMVALGVHISSTINIAYSARDRNLPQPNPGLLKGPFRPKMPSSRWCRAAGVVVKDIVIDALLEVSWPFDKIEDMCKSLGLGPISSKAFLRKAVFRDYALMRRANHELGKAHRALDRLQEAEARYYLNWACRRSSYSPTIVVIDPSCRRAPSK